MVKDVAKVEPDFGFSDSDMTMVMTIMMMAVLSQLLVLTSQQTQAQAEALQAQSYRGVTDSRVLHATSTFGWLNLVHEYPFTPWISAFFINDGPGAVEIGINYPDNCITMDVDETRTVTRGGAEERISIIFYRCSAGLRATVRVDGEY